MWSTHTMTAIKLKDRDSNTKFMKETGDKVLQIQTSIVVARNS